MGNCKYCGGAAGLFRDKHAECEAQHQQREQLVQNGRDRITAEISRAIIRSEDLDGLFQTIAQIEQSTCVPSTERRTLLVRGWENSVEQFLEDGIIDADEENRLLIFKEKLSLSQGELDRNGTLTKFAKSLVLRDILNGEIPQRISVNGSLPINFQKGEQVVWVFPGSQYLEDKTRRTFVGGSQGVSVRVMKGVYLRSSAFKGHAVERTERVFIDSGLVVATNKNLYFSGPSKSFRIPYTKIISFEPFSDGIGVMRDAATAKPQIFLTGDGWFTYNLVTNLCQM